VRTISISFQYYSLHQLHQAVNTDLQQIQEMLNPMGSNLIFAAKDLQKSNLQTGLYSKHLFLIAKPIVKFWA
jgi:gamma-glutamylcysteine synthetase